jgi:hypothetical protein
VRSRNCRIALATLIACLFAWPASAQALTVSLKDDNGVDKALDGLTIRNMAPQLTIAPAPADLSYSAAVTGPNGQTAMTTGCTTSGAPWPVRYQGNGAYTFSVSIYPAGGCGGQPTMGTLTFAIAAGVALSSDPNLPLLTREPQEFANVEHRLPLTANPGASAYDVRYSTNPAVKADGGLVGPVRKAFVDAATQTVPIRFTKPGRYTVVARARATTGAVTPWTTPLSLRVYAPFDFASSGFPDASGPSYRLSVRLRERTASGSVRISVARRWTGTARYRSLGSVRLRKGTFTKRFTLSQSGTYRIRYRFEGSATTAPGTIVEKVRIRRTARSSAAAATHAGPRTLTLLR